MTPALAETLPAGQGAGLYRLITLAVADLQGHCLFFGCLTLRGTGCYGPAFRTTESGSTTSGTVRRSLPCQVPMAKRGTKPAGGYPESHAQDMRKAQPAVPVKYEVPELLRLR